MPVKVAGAQNLLLFFSRVLLLLGLIALLASALWPGFAVHQEMRSQSRAERYAEADYDFKPWGYEKTQTTTVMNQTGILEESNDTAQSPVTGQSSLDYKNSGMSWLTYILTALLVFSAFTAIAIFVLEVRYDPKKPGRTKTTLVLFFPLVFMAVALALLFFFIVPQYSASEFASATDFKPQMPTPAIGSGSGPYQDSGAGSEFDLLFPPGESDTFDFKVSWAPGMALYLYAIASVLFMAAYFFLRAHDRVAAKAAGDPPAKLKMADAKAAATGSDEAEAVEVAVSEEGSEPEQEEDEVEAVEVALEEEEGAQEAPPAKSLSRPATASKPGPAAPAPKPAPGAVAGTGTIAKPQTRPGLEATPPQAAPLRPPPLDTGPKAVAVPESKAPDVLGLDMDGASLGLRMEDEAPTPMTRPSEVTIIEMGEKDFGGRDLEIQGEAWLTLQCPECGNEFKVSSRDRIAKCDRCGLESGIG